MRILISPVFMDIHFKIIIFADWLIKPKNRIKYIRNERIIYHEFAFEKERNLQTAERRTRWSLCLRPDSLR